MCRRDNPYSMQLLPACPFLAWAGWWRGGVEGGGGGGGGRKGKGRRKSKEWAGVEAGLQSMIRVGCRP